MLERLSEEKKEVETSKCINFHPQSQTKYFIIFFSFCIKVREHEKSCRVVVWVKKESVNKAVLVNELNYLIACLNRVNLASTKQSKTKSFFLDTTAVNKRYKVSLKLSCRHHIVFIIVEHTMGG